MARSIETDPTLPASSFPPRGSAARKVLAGGGGLSVAGAVVYYLLSHAAAQDDRIDRMEAHAVMCQQVGRDMREIKRKLEKVEDAQIEQGKDISAILGWLRGRKNGHQ